MQKPKAFCYFDHNSTTPLCPEVLAALPDLAQAWGNPSSIHWGGRLPKNIIRDARAAVAEAVGVSPLEVVFTSGGSEANNMVIRGLFEASQTSQSASSSQGFRNHYMCSEVEHPSVIKTMLHLKGLGARVDFIPVNRDGRIDIEFYQKHLSNETALVSVMYANNETGTIFPIQELAEIAHQRGALFHTDAVQAFGKIPLNLRELGVDFASFSGHKFYSLKGAGFLYCKKGLHISPLIVGGAQERRRRGGTENTLGIGCLGVVAKKASMVAEKAQNMERLRDLFEERVTKEIPEVTVTSVGNPRLSNTSSIVLKGVDGETLLMSLDIQGYAVSTGAACSSGNPEPSPVLLAMGLSRAEAQSSLRVSLGWDTTVEHVHGFVEELKVVVARLRTINTIEGDSIHV